MNASDVLLFLSRLNSRSMESFGYTGLCANCSEKLYTQCIKIKTLQLNFVGRISVMIGLDHDRILHSTGSILRK